MDTSATMSTYRDNDIPAWLTRLQEDWFAAYDIGIRSRHSYRIMRSIEGARHFHKWLESEGFKVNYWEIDIKIDEQVAAYGIEFVDTCEKFIEAKLKIPLKTDEQ
jgi:hypothetical protein